MQILQAVLVAGVLSCATAASGGEMFVGAYGHDLAVLAAGGHEDGAQLAAGYRSEPLRALDRIGAPSLYGLGAVNSNGGVNYAVAGLSWRWGDRLFVRPGLGLAVHDNEAVKVSNGGLNLGRRVLAELELGLGWQVNERLSIEASYVHLSHKRTGGRPNPGLDDIGLRLTYRF